MDSIRVQIQEALLSGASTSTLRATLSAAEANAAAARAAAEEAEEASQRAADAAIDAEAAGIAMSAELDLRELLAGLTPPTLTEDFNDV